MEEPVGLDREGHPRAVGPRRPLSERDATAVVGLRRARPCRGEAAEIMLAQERFGRALELSKIERACQRPLVGPAKRGLGGFLRPDQVAVAPRDGAVARVEPRPHRIQPLDPDVARQQRIQGPPQPGRNCRQRCFQASQKHFGSRKDFVGNRFQVLFSEVGIGSGGDADQVLSGLIDENQRHA